MGYGLGEVGNVTDSGEVVVSMAPVNAVYDPNSTSIFRTFHDTM
jgi:hypothetical protein